MGGRGHTPAAPVVCVCVCFWVCVQSWSLWTGWPDTGRSSVRHPGRRNALFRNSFGGPGRAICNRPNRGSPSPRCVCVCVCLVTVRSSPSLTERVRSPSREPSSQRTHQPTVPSLERAVTEVSRQSAGTGTTVRSIHKVVIAIAPLIPDFCPHLSPGPPITHAPHIAHFCWRCCCNALSSFSPSFTLFSLHLPLFHQLCFLLLRHLFLLRITTLWCTESPITDWSLSRFLLGTGSNAFGHTVKTQLDRVELSHQSEIHSKSAAFYIVVHLMYIYDLKKKLIFSYSFLFYLTREARN